MIQEASCEVESWKKYFKKTQEKKPFQGKNQEKIHNFWLNTAKTKF